MQTTRLADIEATDFRSFCPSATQLDHALLSCRHTPPADGNLNGGTYYPSADDLRRMRTEAHQREVRALLNAPH